MTEKEAMDWLTRLEQVQASIVAEQRTLIELHELFMTACGAITQKMRAAVQEVQQAEALTAMQEGKPEDGGH